MNNNLHTERTEVVFIARIYGGKELQVILSMVHRKTENISIHEQSILASKIDQKIINPNKFHHFTLHIEQITKNENEISGNCLLKAKKTPIYYQDQTHLDPILRHVPRRPEQRQRQH